MSTLIGATTTGAQPTHATAVRSTPDEGITDRLQKGHIPALDGVRGLAILLVLFFHFMLVGGNGAGPRLIQKTWGYGWAGVDLFFVLSGFLITGILLDAKSKRPTAGSFFKNFYARRTVRIFPLYYAFLIVFLLILPHVMSGFYELYGRPPTGEWTYWTYTYNLFQGHHQGAKEFSHSMGVTWSLCIEEQFYLIWPTIVWFCRPKTLLKICAGLVLMSMIARGLVDHYSGYHVFATQWSFCRMDPLAIGASIAILTRIAPQRVIAARKYLIHLLWLIPLVIVGWNAKMGSLVNSKAFLIGGYTSLGIMFGSLLLVTITAGGTGPFVWALSNPVLRLFGKLSYAMYLFNQPIKYALLKYVYGFTDPTQEFNSVTTQIGFFVFATVLTVAAAWISWHAFEKHFLRLKVFFPMDRAAAQGARDPLAASPIAIPQPNARA